MHKNYHIFKVTYHGWTNTKPSRIKVYSERHHKSFWVSMNEAKDGEQTHDLAARFLKDKGFKIKGIGTGSGCMYVISSTFNSL